MTLSPGTRLGPYEVIAPIGAGGMGEVYKARDTRLGREVAIKVLPETTARDPDALARFEREARAVAALSHPNILSIFDFGTHEGAAYAVMELLEGGTLRSALDGGALPPRRAVDYALQIATGLRAAHEKGIVHRDLKPENVFVSRDGHVKILDFGLAKRTERTSEPNATNLPTASIRTLPGTVMGTVDYMSPEQVRGEPVDHRSDLFAFGSVLFEMLTGRKPFARGSGADTMAAILMADAPELPESAGPGALSRVVRHCLEKSPDQRFQSARDLAFNLQPLVSGHSESSPSAPEGVPTVAVLPFLNFSSDPENEFFADGMTEDVIAHLSKIRSVKVISRTSVMAFKKREQSLREIGKTLGADAILEGSIRRAGNRVRIVSQLIDAATDEHLWADTYDRELVDIFAIQTDVALHIAAALQAELSLDERSRIARKPTRNTHAYQLYLQGRHAFHRNTENDYRRALVYLEQAVAEAPELAVGYAAIAQLYTEVSAQGLGNIAPSAVALNSAKNAAEKALRLDDGLGDAHSIFATVKFMRDYDWTGAEREFQLALSLAPGSGDVYDLYGWMCSALGRHEDAIRLVTRAKELDPLAHASDLGTELLRAGRYSEGLEEARRVLEFDPSLTRAHSLLGWANVLLGRYEEGLPALERAVAISGDGVMFESQLGQAYAMAGRRDEARRILDKLREAAKTSYVAPYHFAYVLTGLGEADAAMDWLEMAYAERAGAIYGIKGSFLFRDLRDHPRFQALLKQMNLA
jgi:serine/threonine-protein kinase